MRKARLVKMEHMEMKISQHIFGILVALTKNEVTKICNEPGISSSFKRKQDTFREKNRENMSRTSHRTQVSINKAITIL